MSECDFIVDLISKIGEIYDPILELGTREYLEQLHGQVRASYKLYSQGRKENWGLTIPHNVPVRFKESERPTKTQVDIYCDIRWTGDRLPENQDIKLRVWSLDNDIIWRPGLDSEDVLNKLAEMQSGARRVVSRYHFDRANHAHGRGIEYHPKYHLQIGGKSEEYEMCWHPKTYDIPRIAHHPMDLFLTCQFVAINFFPKSYKTEIGKDGSWDELTKACQRKYLVDYFAQCLNSVRQGILLDDLSS